MGPQRISFPRLRIFTQIFPLLSQEKIGKPILTGSEEPLQKESPEMGKNPPPFFPGF